jgi:hypothetical protein
MPVTEAAKTRRSAAGADARGGLLQQLVAGESLD